MQQPNETTKPPLTDWAADWRRQANALRLMAACFVEDAEKAEARAKEIEVQEAANAAAE